MVKKVGFIVEGETEMFFIKRNAAFKDFLSSIHVDVVVSIDGNGGELHNPEILNRKKLLCKDAGAEHIFILTDLDEESCYTEKKSKLDLENVSCTIIAKRAFEAWFLADTETINKVIGNGNYYCEAPENLTNPFEQIRQLHIEYKNGRGIGGKPLLAAKMNKNGFNVLNAAQHPNCHSATYFVEKLKGLTA